MKRLLLTIGAAAVAAMCQAGVKYWDNPDFKAFDVGDYAAGAVWNYDGIRNSGADAAHDNSAATWVNLGMSGSANDLTKRSVGTGGDGFWASDGYVFNGGTRWYGGASVSVSGSWTVQMLVDASLSAQTCDDAPVASVMIDHFAFLLNKTNDRFYARLNNKSTFPQFSIASVPTDYATVILDNEALTATAFPGTTPPTSGDGFKTFASAIGSKSTTGYGLGSTSTDGQQFVGTLKSFRWYQRVLTPEELAWNRVVDEARFFGRTAPLPVTNAVVATSVAGLSGNEPPGTYAVDAEGHVFTAPRVARLNGAKYLCSGYTLETWDGTAWRAPVRVQSRFCEVSSDDLVRIVWQWKDATGLATYDIHDYVWADLKYFYDGIRNAGTNAPHSATATIWKNLGSEGSENDVFLQLLNAAGNGWSAVSDIAPVGERDPGEWTDTGFALRGDSRFRVVATGGQNGQISVGSDYSIQMLMDAKTADQKWDSAFPFSLSVYKFSFVISKAGEKLYFKSDASYDDSEKHSSITGTAFDYVTAIQDGTAATTAVFPGTKIPSDGDGFRQYASVSGHTERGYDLGGYGNANHDKLLTGEIKSFRIYDHSLTPAEIARNRAVDEFRFFGRATVTNVIVQSTLPYLQGDEPDSPYGVEGAYTFTAPATATAPNGVAYACDGYTVETWDGSAWSSSVSYESCSYTYTPGSSPTLVRLTWLWRATRGIRSATDYSFDDYSQAGLVWNYDGIYNAGVGKHDSSSTTWKNLGCGGDAYDLNSFQAATTGEWADDGYIFRGGPRLRRSGANVGPLKSFTVQSLVDADIADQTGSSSGAHYIFSVMWDYFSFGLRENDATAYKSALYWNAQSPTANSGKHKVLYFRNNSGHYDYATVIMDYDAKTGVLFPGVEVPASGTGFCRFDSVVSRNTSGYGVGNGGSGTEGLVGTLKSLRYYDRVLTQEEIVRNRNVDAVRYFGALGVTNVFVVAGGGTQTETGAYKVEGEWTFTATTTLNRRGEKVNVERYSVETLENGAWTNKQTYNGNSYIYTEGTSPATVRLTWLGAPIGTTISLK